MAEVQRILASHPAVKPDNRVVSLDALAASAVEVLVEFYVDVSSREDELRVRNDVFREFLALPQRTGVRFAFPTQTIYLAP